MEKSLYERLGGYDAIAAVATSLVSKMQQDSMLEKFWMNRSRDSVDRELQLLIDYLCASAGGSLYYKGRDMKLSHAGMRLDNDDWSIMNRYLAATLDEFSVPEIEKQDVINFVGTLKDDIIEA